MKTLSLALLASMALVAGGSAALAAPGTIYVPGGYCRTTANTGVERLSQVSYTHLYSTAPGTYAYCPLSYDSVSLTSGSVTSIQAIGNFSGQCMILDNTGSLWYGTNNSTNSITTFPATSVSFGGYDALSVVFCPLKDSNGYISEIQIKHN